MGYAMFRPGSLFFACTVGCAAMLTYLPTTSSASAQSAQYPAQNAQLALATPTASGGMLMLRSEASVLFSAGQYAAAADAYRRLLQLGSADANDRYWLGESLYHTSNFQQAVAAFEQAIQLNPKLQQAYVRLTETYLALHQKEKAMQICTSGLHVVTDTYMKEQLSNLLKVSMHQERKQIRPRELQAARLPSET